jgi:hypothetical protein
MTRFFFDYTMKDESLFDYRGEEFRSACGAADFAEAVADVLRHSMAADWTGWSVEVRNAEGTKLFSLPVDSADFERPRSSLVLSAFGPMSDVSHSQSTRSGSSLAREDETSVAWAGVVEI